MQVLEDADGAEEGSLAGRSFGDEGRELTRSQWASYTDGMEVQLTPDQKAFVRQAIASGRLEREEDAVKEALSLWEQRERARSELLMTLDEAECDLGAGLYAEYSDESLPQLAAELKREA